MAMHICLEDNQLGLTAVVRVSGGYNPDILDDLKSRAVAMLQDAAINRAALGIALSGEDAEIEAEVNSELEE